MSKILDGIIKTNKNLVWDKTQLTVLFVGFVCFKREDNILPYKVCEIQFVPILFVGVAFTPHPSPRATPSPTGES